MIVQHSFAAAAASLAFGGGLFWLVDFRPLVGALLLVDEIIQDNPSLRLVAGAIGAFLGFIGAFVLCRYFVPGLPAIGWAVYFGFISIYWIVVAMVLAPRGGRGAHA